MTNNLTQLVQTAITKALETLIRVADDASDPRQARMAAAEILRYTNKLTDLFVPPRAETTPARASVAPHAETPPPPTEPPTAFERATSRRSRAKSVLNAAGRAPTSPRLQTG